MKNKTLVIQFFFVLLIHNIICAIALFGDMGSLYYEYCSDLQNFTTIAFCLEFVLFSLYGISSRIKRIKCCENGIERGLPPVSFCLRGKNRLSIKCQCCVCSREIATDKTYVVNYSQSPQQTAPSFFYYCDNAKCVPDIRGLNNAS